MQLGPVLRSKHSHMFGLNMSYLERMINLDIYARDDMRFADHGCYDPLLVSAMFSGLCETCYPQGATISFLVGWAEDYPASNFFFLHDFAR